METKFKPYRALVLNIPHASTNIPEAFMPIQPWIKKLNPVGIYLERSRPLIDYFTDELFFVENDERIIPIVATICRTLCDVERMINDPLENDGYGIICSKIIRASSPTSGSCPSHWVMRYYDYKPTNYNLLQYYLDYQHKLSSNILKHSFVKGYPHVCQDPNSVLLIDCHSFSSMPTALCDPGPQEEQVDICLGYNDDATCPPQELIDFVASYFENLGYRVGRNTPFSHSKTVECPVPYHSLMIEVNKRCYMNEQTLEKTKGFVRLRYEIEGLYSHILKDGGYRILF
jgi:N-formylglutamate amidohydrolase